MAVASSEVADFRDDGTIVLAVPFEVIAGMLEKHLEALVPALTGSLGGPVQIEFVVDPGLRPPETDVSPTDIVEAAEAELEAARQAGEIAYYARVLAQIGLPYTAKQGSEFVRNNGRLTVTILSPSHIGLPYGTIPRLLICWLTTEAVRTKDPVLHLGHSCSEFLAKIGLTRTGGAKGDITRLRLHMNRLFSSHVQVSYLGENRDLGAGLTLADEYDLWWQWNPAKRDQGALWQSTVSLSHAFFKEVVTRPVPIDLISLRKLRRSPLLIDMYVWLAHRMSYLDKPTTIPWSLLQAQFGSDCEPWRFRSRFMGRLGQVTAVWPELRAEQGVGGLRLLPSPTPVARRRLSR
jgi:hypothetical protein